MNTTQTIRSCLPWNLKGGGQTRKGVSVHPSLPNHRPGKQQGWQVVRRSSRSRGFTLIANDTLRDSRLSFKARGLLCYLLSHESGWTRSAEQIASEGGDGRDAVRSALRELEKVGYLVRRRVHRDGQITWDHEVYDSPEDAQAEAASVAASVASTGTNGREIRPQADQGRCDPEDGFPDDGKPVLIQKTILEKKNIPSLADASDGDVEGHLPGLEPPKGASKVVQMPTPMERDFDLIWSLYPRRVARQAALGKYLATRRKGAPADLLLRAARHYAATCIGKEPEFVMHAATFFGPHERWKDYLEPAKAAASKGSGSGFTVNGVDPWSRS